MRLAMLKADSAAYAVGTQDTGKCSKKKISDQMGNRFFVFILPVNVESNCQNRGEQGVVRVKPSRL